MISSEVDTLIHLLRLPGDAGVDWLTRHAPLVANALAFDATGNTFAIVISVLTWLAVLILAGVVMEWTGRLDRTLTAWVARCFGGIRRQLRVLRRRIVSTIGQMRQRRLAKATAIDVVEISLERLETAVLRCHAGIGEIEVMAAADVAGVLRVSRNQVRKAISTLREYRLIEPVPDTVVGSEGHCITRAGQIYLIEH